MFAVVATIGACLSAAGLYALLAFSVAQRGREIAIRVALGAQRSSIVRAVVGRALVQLTAGIVLGAGLAALVVPEVLNEHTQTRDWRAAAAIVSAGLIAIGLAGCSLPTRRALRIEPIDALKAE